MFRRGSLEAHHLAEPLGVLADQVVFTPDGTCSGGGGPLADDVVLALGEVHTSEGVPGLFVSH